MSLLRLALVSALAFLLFLVAGDSPPASAATFTVTKTVDTEDGACDADCSLREAIIAANLHAGAGTINVPPGIYVLTMGELDIIGDATIVGAGPSSSILDGAGLDRVFDIGQGGAHITVQISGVTIRNGDARGAFGGGGIYSYNATLTLKDLIVSGNRADRDGGGIMNDEGVLTITDSTISGNTSGGKGGGIHSDSPLTITRSTVSDNVIQTSSPFGTGGEGGGIYFWPSVEGPALVVSDSTISANNTNGGSGAGLHIGGSATITNTTISGNDARGLGGYYGDGGGIEARFAFLTIVNSTIVGNASGDEGGGIYASARAKLKNTIVANNTAPPPPGHGGPNCSGFPVSERITLGHNLDSDDSNWCLFDGPGDLTNTDPKLGPLADNGGPTQTHALLPGSPAIDAGDDADCPATDQRGESRPKDGNGDGSAVCDIGAYEHEAAPAGTPTATATSTPPATPTPAVSTWNHTCYIGAEQPIQQALADIAADVQAVYRLNASQTFDTWFPGRPELSTITTVSPYQPLLILMSTGATWSQQPSGTPPTSVSLAQGWNSVCYTGQTESPGDATAGIAGAFSILYRLGSDQIWAPYVPDRPEVSNISQLAQYDAVLVLVNAEGGAQWVFGP